MNFFKPYIISLQDDEENKKEWCVSDEQELYKQLVKICRAYFNKKSEKPDREVK